MVIIKKRKYIKPPEKYNYEKYCEDINEYIIRGYQPPSIDSSNSSNSSLNSSNSSMTNNEYKNEYEYDNKNNLPPIYSTSWGWNSNGRAGNITADEIREPRYTQHSAGPRFIACSAGKHHSLLVSDDGSVYSFGDGRKGQLGYGTPFFDKPPKGGILQVFPKLVNPSGTCKHGRDVKIVEVACGESFSIAREGSLEDGVDLCPGLRALEQALIKLKDIYPDCVTIQYAWAQARQERFILSTYFEGKLLSWGTGKYGELGQGRYHCFTSYPQIIPKLDFVTIVKVSAGANHVLAVSKDGILFSWGKGKSGRLGHGNNHDQYYPKSVSYLQLYHVNTCAAGDAHSAVILTRKKPNSKGIYTKAVATFGRGAHGRLGLGHNKSISLPDVVKVWPPSFTDDYDIIQVACGGAHTLILAYQDVKKTLANPFGVVTYVAGWGYGANGQLGQGQDLTHHFIPIKVKLPKWEIICEVSAGRSWSLARTLSGELYSWGKGLRGQLGLGKQDFSIAPRKVNTFASFLSISSQYAHNLSVTTTKKVLSIKNVETFIDDIKNSQLIPGEDPITVFQAAKKRLHMRLADHKGLAMSAFDCCRRNIKNYKQSKIRVHCINCKISDICILCAKICHKNHQLIENNNSMTNNVTFCKCGVFNLKCHLLPSILECNNEYGIPPKEPIPVIPIENLKKEKPKILLKKKSSSLSLSNKEVQTPKVKIIIEPELIDPGDLPRVYTNYILKAVKSIQTLARSYIGRNQLKRMMKYVRYVRRTACERYVNDTLMGAIWKKFNRCKDEYRTEKELIDMRYEDEARKLYDFYHNLQAGLVGMDTMMDGIYKLLQQSSIYLPSQDDILKLIKRKYITNEYLQKISIHPSFIFSVHTLKMIERLKHPSKRLPIIAIAKLCRYNPIYDSKEGEFYDIDINQITARFIRHKDKEKETNLINQTCDNIIMELKEEAAKKSKKNNESNENLNNNGNNGNNNNNNNTLSSQSSIIINKQPIPPPGPPRPPPGKPGAPQPPIINNNNNNNMGIKSKYQKKKDIKVPEKPKTVYEALKQRDQALIKLERRKSIAGPEMLYTRLQKMRIQTKKRCIIQRRNSLPDRLYRLYGDTIPPFSYVTSILKSLDMYTMRQVILEEFLLKEYQIIWKKTSAKTKKHKMHLALKYSWLTPRLPIEMRRLVIGKGSPERRHSIGEPERFGQQVKVMFETRNNFLLLRNRAIKNKIPVRRRSYDFGELLDHSELINSTLGYNFEEIFKVPTKFELKADGLKMERLLLETNFKTVDIEAMLKIPNKNNGTDDAIEVWMEYYDENGYPYYYNTNNGETAWEAPQGWNIHLWSQYQDVSTGEWYWYNNTTGETASMT